MPHKNEEEKRAQEYFNRDSDDDVAPKDKAERIARQYEEGQHERAGNKTENETPSHSIKPRSVR